MSVDILQEKIRKMKNPSMLELAMPLCDLPPRFEQTAAGYGAFCRCLLEGLRETMPAVRVSFAAFALLGMVFVSGMMETGIPALSEAKGVLYGLGAACFYATVVLMNKKITDINAYDKTIMQLGMGAIVLTPYVMLNKDIGTAALSMTPPLWALLLFVGLVHTGVAYVLYFDALKDLKAQTVAIFSYIDPIVAILLSALLLKENMGIYGVIGAVLVLGSTFISELPEKERN